MIYTLPDPRRRVLLRILGGGVPPGSPNPELISDQKISFSTSVFRPERLSDSWGDSPVFTRFIFVFALSQLGGPNYLGPWNRLGLN